MTSQRLIPAVQISNQVACYRFDSYTAHQLEIDLFGSIIATSDR